MTNTQQKEANHALEQAKTQLESIKELVKAYNDASIKDDDNSEETARQHILEDVLSVEVREGWHTAGDKGVTEEFKILLCTGGPAVQIIGDLDTDNEPHTAFIQYQDWGTPWTNYPLSSEETEIVLEYCRHFYFYA